MKITEIYEKYKIPPNLQLHQLRVAGVAKIICDNFKKELDENSIVTACLLHDMGNIIKFNFDIFDDGFYAPEGRDYWKNVQREFREKHGDDEHIATEKIFSELSVSHDVLEIINNIGFPYSDENYKNNDYSRKICSYSDMRVAPNNVILLQKRLADLRIRYSKNNNPDFTKENFNHYKSYWEKIQDQIFKHCKIKPSDITDENVNPLVEDLKDFKIILSG